MSEKHYSLNALRVFAVAASASSFKHAAQQLNVSQSAITRHIQTLEQQLGTKLFQRDNRVHSLTPAGKALAPELLRLFQQLDRAVDRARDSGDQAHTTLKVYLPESFLRWWVAPRLADFKAIYPHIRLQFTTTADFLGPAASAELCASLQHEEVDLALHYGTVRDRSLRKSKLYQPTYVPISAVPQASTDMAQQTWLVNPDDPVWHTFSKKQRRLAEALTLVPVDKLTTAIDLNQGSQHIAFVDVLALSHPSLSGWTAYNDYQIQLQDSIYCLMKERDRQPVAIVAFLKWLENRLQSAARG